MKQPPLPSRVAARPQPPPETTTFPHRPRSSVISACRCCHGKRSKNGFGWCPVRAGRRPFTPALRRVCVRARTTKRRFCGYCTSTFSWTDFNGALTGSSSSSCGGCVLMRDGLLRHRCCFCGSLRDSKICGTVWNELSLSFHPRIVAGKGMTSRGLTSGLHPGAAPRLLGAGGGDLFWKGGVNGKSPHPNTGVCPAFMFESTIVSDFIPDVNI